MCKDINRKKGCQECPESFGKRKKYKKEIIVQSSSRLHLRNYNFFDFSFFNNFDWFGCIENCISSSRWQNSNFNLWCWNRRKEVEQMF